MEVADYVAHLRREGGMLADAAARAGLDAAVPTCPEWVVRDLVRHVGDVHRWARATLTAGTAEPMTPDARAALEGTWPADDAALLEWLRSGVTDVADALAAAPRSTVAWTFFDAPSPVAFWARRQAHETAVHRADVDGAAGGVPAAEPAYDAAFAVDGIEEVLHGFAARSRRLSSDPARTLYLDAADASRGWLLSFGPEGLAVASAEGSVGTGADCTVHGPASDLYLLLWNRRTLDGLQVGGDAAVLAHWREGHQVRWGRR